MTDQSYLYFYGGEGRKHSVYISPEDGSCVKCPTPDGRNSRLMLIVAALVIVLAGFLNHLFQTPLHAHRSIPVAMLLISLLAAVITYPAARNGKRKTVARTGQPILKNEISAAHIALGQRQLKTDQKMLIALAVVAVISGICFYLSCNVLLWLCCTACLVVFAALAGPMDLTARKELYRWLTVYASHPEWTVMQRYSKGYLTLSKKGRYYPDNNIRAVATDGTILWDIGSIQPEPVSQGYDLLERLDGERFRVRSCSEDFYLLQADIPSLIPAPEEAEIES